MGMAYVIHVASHRGSRYLGSAADVERAVFRLQ